MSNQQLNIELDLYLNDFNTKYSVITLGSKAMILEEGRDEADHLFFRFIDIQSFKHLTANINLKYQISKIIGNVPQILDKTLNVGTEWLKWENRNTYTKCVFEPNWTQSERPDSKYFNQWKGFKYLPFNHKDQKGNIKFYWSFVFDVICNKDQDSFDYVKNWLAHMVQKPSELPGVALVLRGEEGVGKGTFVKPLGLLVGDNFGEYSTMSRITNNFNGHLSNKLLVNANEATWGGDKQNEGVLKALITDEDRSVEYKGKDSLEIKNFIRLIICSNNDWCVPAGPGQRRFVFLNVSHDHKEDLDYFNKFKPFLKSKDFIEALHYDLLQVDLSLFKTYQRPNSSELNGLDAKELSMSNEQKFILEFLDHYDWSRFDIDLRNINCVQTTMEILHNAYIEFCDKHKILRREGKTTLSKLLFGRKSKGEYYGGSIELIEKKNYADGNVTTLKYSFPNKNISRTYYEENILHQKYNWSDEVFKKDKVKPNSIIVEGK